MLPESFLKSLQGLPGYDPAGFERVHAQNEQVTSVRLNSDKLFEIGGHPFLNDTQGVPWCKHGVYLNERPSFVLDPLWHAGAYYVQEASSMFVSFILENIMPLTHGKIALDLCAAPGGKSTLLANHFKNGLLVSNETIKSRNAILVENMTKWGSDHVIVTQNDPAHFKRLPHFFDLMLIDAPCSGSGMFRKDPNAIKEWSEQNVQHCSTRQARILDDSIDILKEGGYLIYATCSYSFEEDEKMMDYISSISGMQNIALNVPDEWNIVSTESPLTKSVGYRFYPDQVKGEGFFVSVFQKQTRENVDYFNSIFNWDLISKQQQALLNAHFAIPENYILINHQNNMLAIPRYFEMHIKAVLANLYVKKLGLNIGELKGNDLIPAHDLAVSNWENIPYQTIHVQLQTALNYLRRADLELEGEKGWKVVCFQNIRLGWAKLLGNRSNNYYPNNWRILNY